VFKKKRRQGYRRLHGHRQFYTELFVKSIQAPGGEAAEADKTAVVVDPAKKAARLAKLATEGKTPAVKVKKAAGAKAAPKKAAGKKKSTAKKSGGAKKATTTKKKASK
jgi:large subunit ribosomal protein L21